MSFEKLIPLSRDLKLSFTSHENLVESFKEVDEETTILIPVGKYKREFILKKEVVAINASNYNFEKIKQYLKLANNKIVLVFKSDQHVDKFFDNKIYINKFGEVTEYLQDAEDLIVMNYKYE